MCSGVDSTVRKAHCQPSDRLNSCNRSGAKCDAAWTTWHAHGLSGNARCPMAMRIAIGIMESWDDCIGPCVRRRRDRPIFLTAISQRVSTSGYSTCTAGTLRRRLGYRLTYTLHLRDTVVVYSCIASCCPYCCCWTTLVQLICTLQL